jgi:adenosylcobinamide-GDP ribazoletransferase
MKDLFASLCIALSMYSRIPCPQVEWSEKGMKYALCFFPLIGVVIGVLMCGYHYLTAGLGLLGPVAYACLGTVLPLAVTGGIHMDGLLDTADALSSFQPREKKLEILKDPHTGAFAIIGCGIYLLVYVAVFSELGADAFPAGAAVYVLCRAISGWSVVSFPKAKKDGLVSTFSMKAEHRVVRWTMELWAAASCAWLVVCAGIITGGAVILAAIFTAVWYHRMAIKEFGGVTGDLAGCFLQICELVCLTVLAILT